MKKIIFFYVVVLGLFLSLTAVCFAQVAEGRDLGPDKSGSVQAGENASSTIVWPVSFAPLTDSATSTDTQTASTIMTASTGGGLANAAPIVKAKWEMKDGYAAMSGADDNPEAGAQFNPSGAYRVDKNISLCAVATDPDGLADINAVYGDVYYPDVAVHQAGDSGCGKIVGTECSMVKLAKADGLSLFCDKVRNQNTNLPVFSAQYNYDDICKADGQLQKETAAVFCCDKSLSYEDPSGNYEVKVFTQDKSGMSSSPLENIFTYEPVISFDIDFSTIDYGNVKLNIRKVVSGDLIWNVPRGTNGATVRNTGNTRVKVNVLQDDIGLGKTGTAWNVAWGARIGNAEADWANYSPNNWVLLKKSLDLSETNEMDFSADISKFPAGTGPDYHGTITLRGEADDHLPCPD
ncbi:MAG: hypothetical protein MUD10_05335 [Candidatus Pacebacteria bacterium]|nr:hypothetical protein [Candidatus Paceibacterota bacterium]